MLWSVRAALVAWVVSTTSGCVLVPALDSIRGMGITKEDRMRLLPGEVKRYHEALFWGNEERALSFVDPKSVNTIRATLRKRKKDDKIVESKVAAPEYTPDGYEAEVTVSVRQYNQSTLVVEEHQEREHWAFQYKDGWKLVQSGSGDAP